MTLFEHLDSIDETISKRQQQENQNSLLLVEGGGGFQTALGKGFHSSSNLPWKPGSWYAKESGADWDHDGYPDFVDFYYGSGAYSFDDHDLPGDK